MMTRKNDTFSSSAALDDVTVFEALNWMQLHFLPIGGTMISTLS